MHDDAANCTTYECVVSNFTSIRFVNMRSKLNTRKFAIRLSIQLQQYVPQKLTFLCYTNPCKSIILKTDVN